MKEFKIKDQRGVEAWCMQFIGPRIFYLHDKIGGQGWCIKMSRKTYPTIIIEDNKHALMAMIKFGFEI